MKTTFKALTGRTAITTANRYVANSKVTLSKGENVVAGVKCTGLTDGANDTLRGQVSDTGTAVIKQMYWRNKDGVRVGTSQTRTSTPKADLPRREDAHNGLPFDLVMVTDRGGSALLNFHLIDR